MMKGPRFWVAAMVIAGVAMSSACRSSSQPSGTPPANVWATVDGRTITRDDVEKLYRSTTQPNAAPLSDDEMLATKLSVLDDLISQDILLAKARTLGVAATDSEIEAAIAEQKRGMSDEDFQKQLGSRSLTVDDFRNGLRREMSVQKVLDREVTAKAVITDDQIAAFYNQNKAQFNLPEAQYRIAQIVVTPARDPQLRNRSGNDAGSVDEATRKFDMLLERLRAGADFAALAMDYSEDPQSVAQGGDIGFVSRSQLNDAPAALRDVVLKTAPGSVSTVAGGGSLTIIKVLAHEPAGQRELGTPAVRDGVRDLLQQRKAQLLRVAYITAVRDEATILNHLAQMVRDANGVPPALATAPAGPAPAAASGK
ncbi:MAG: SurA N-terminal domain-containing protein [Acidobacteria bacterium]|nr:SurA N-terminal domain-containing protein [Acidobacteriota bacterium]